MKRLILFLLLSVFSTTSFAQVLKGRVLDNESKEPIPYANVYINNTFRGTSSDLNGEFTLNIDELYGQGVVISCIGYESILLEKIDPERSYAIYLDPKATFLEEVTISADEDFLTRKQKEKMFLSEFLGETKNAKSCVITNLDKVDLVYTWSTQTLIADASEPLIIYNKALGYSITYFLSEFQKTGDNIRYHGYAIFKENLRPVRRQINKAQANRKKAYLGSRMHFFRMLWRDQIEGSDFEILDTESQTLPELEISFADSVNGLKQITHQKKLTVRFNHGARSYVNFKDNKTIYFNRNGYFDPSGHSWEGLMATKRVGDLLPYEYWPDQEEDLKN